MPPYGRRRTSLLIIVISSLLLFTSIASAASAVLGIDLGTEYIKAALVKPGIPLEIVLTKDSKRKETAAVAFKPLKSQISTSDPDVFPERIYGGDALALSARFPADVYPNLKPLLGMTLTQNEVVNQYQSKYPGLRIVEGKGSGGLGFSSESFGSGKEPFLVEELLAMELQNIRSNAEALAGKGSSIRDVVVTIPAFYTIEEKMAVELAADLAGLRVLALISDGLSVGVNYAVSRTFPSINEGGKPEIHLVYDMGAGSTTATILRFQGRTIKDVGRFNKTIQEVQVLGTSWDRTLGGDALNAVILTDMVQKFANINRMKTLGVQVRHIREQGRTMAKLWKEAEKIRQVLSANTETSSSFEGLYYEDVNFKYKLTRDEFERLAQSYAHRVQDPITQALELAKLSLDDLESVILHGGAVRTPFVQKQLEAVVANAEKIRTNVNSDEAAVFGAAFKAAGISPNFRVKDIRAGEAAGYAVTATWSLDGKEREQKIFVPSSQVGLEKQVPFKASEDFSFVLSQQVSSDSSSSISKPGMKVQTQNLTASVERLIEKVGCTLSDISTVFSIRLSPRDGLPEVIQGSVSCEGTEKKGSVVKDMKDFFGFGSKKSDQEPLKEDRDSEPVPSSSEAEPSITSTTEESTSSTSPTKKAEAKTKDVQKKMETIDLNFSVELIGIHQVDPSEITRMKDRLAAFDASDRSRALREETLNTLEGFTYKARDLLSDDAFIAASTESQRSEIETQFKIASEWLYGDGAEASRDTLKARLKDLRYLVDPIQKRKDETAKRPQEVKMLQDALDQTRTLVSVIKEQTEKASSVAALSSSAEAASSASASDSQTTEPPSSSTDDAFADLDDDPITSSSTTTSTPIPTPQFPTYTPEDLASITSTYDSISTWLSTQTASQNLLGPTDDPILLTSDLAAKAQELQTVISKLLQKKVKTPPMKPKVSSSAKSKSGAGKKGKKGKDGAAGGGSVEDVFGEGVTQEEIERLVEREKGKLGKGKGKEKGKKGKGKEKESEARDEL
ncbi:lumenal Hsp70 protein [Toensbergia leucococca]|nr:lumenal Hsp70 protein [Toensbergia leucococca]